MKTKQAKQKLYDAWVEEVFEYIKETGSKIDRCANVLISKPVLDKQPDIVYLNLNTNEDLPYVTADKKRFYYGHPYFQTNREEWKMWANLQQAFTEINYTRPVTEGNYVLMNALYFGFNKVNQLKKEMEWHELDLTFDEIPTQSFTFTSRLIHSILQPKCVVCFSINNCFKPIHAQFDFEQEEEILVHTQVGNKTIETTLLKAKWNGIPIFGITHPAASIRKEETINLTQALAQELRKILE